MVSQHKMLKDGKFPVEVSCSCQREVRRDLNNSKFFYHQRRGTSTNDGRYVLKWEVLKSTRVILEQMEVALLFHLD